MDRWHLGRFLPTRIAVAALMGMLCLPALTPAFAGSALSVRLVEAHNESDQVAGGLDDVIGTLRKNLQYQGFALLSSKSMGLPADGTVGLSRGFKLRCKGAQSGLQVTLFKGKSTLLETTLNLRDGSPVVLGGFQSKRGRVLVVLVAR